MSYTVECSGCKKKFEAGRNGARGLSQMIVTGIGSFQICVYMGGPRSYEYKPECVLLAMRDRCWCCGKEHSTEFKLNYRKEFSFVCDICRKAAIRGASEESEHQSVRLYERALGYEGEQSVKLLADLLDPSWERGRYGDLGIPVGAPEHPSSLGESTLALRLFPKQVETLQAFVKTLRAKIDKEVAEAGKRGRSLLLQLSQGEISTKEYDARIGQEERRK